MGELDLSGVLTQLLDDAQKFDGETASTRNLIDPFAAVLETVLMEYKTREEWLQAEHQRTRQKALMNRIGDLQQSIIGKLPGWTAYETGTDMPDVVGNRGQQMFICEVKNKHNTMNARSTAATYDALAEFLSRPEFGGYTAAVVAVISPVRRGSYFKPFAPPRKPERLDIVSMSGRVFYALATDPQNRIPYKSVQPNDPMHLWESWSAIDLMLTEFWNELEIQTGYAVPIWIQNLSEQALGT